MGTKSLRPKKPMRTAVDLAVAAVEDSGHPLDLDVGDLDTSPTVLDLPQKERRESCSRCGRPAMDRCPECGQPHCEDCGAGDRERA